MDTTEADTRLNDLRQALKELPTTQPKAESASGSEVNLESWDINSIAALTTLDLNSLTSSQINWASANTAVQLGGNGPSIYTISGGGGGSGAVTYHPNTWTTTGTSWNTPTTKITADEIEIRGKSLAVQLDRIEQRLGILDCDETLEADWEELRELGTRYRELKQHIEDKIKTFETLKK